MQRSLTLFLSLLLFSCSQPHSPAVNQLTGRTMGTTYQVSIPFEALDVVTTQSEIDELLVDLNQSVSTYIETSLISTINASADTSIVHTLDDAFVAIYKASESIYASTNGAFNPAIGPLVRAYGFDSEEAQDLSDTQIDSLLELVNFASFIIDADLKTLKKTVAGARLDFSAIAKGYGVDLVGEYLESQGVTNYFVEIGGEVRTRGMHPEDRPWKLGIDVPDENPAPNTRPLQAIIPMEDNASATSGNYRNFYIKDGQKYVHTINPATGRPEISSLLSVTVLAKDCATADAYATAFMVMGLDRANQLVEQHDELEAYFISAGENGAFIERFTSGFPEKLE